MPPVGVVHPRRVRRGFARDGFVSIDADPLDGSALAEVMSLLEGVFTQFETLRGTYAQDLGDVALHGGPQQLPEIVRTLELEPRLRDTAAFARCERIAETVLGGPVVCYFDHAIFKPPHNGVATDWHQDVAYSPTGNLGAAAHIWLALDEVDATNGCLWFIPGSHRLGRLAHSPRGGSPLAHALAAGPVDTTGAVACPLPAGGVTVHGPATLHYAGPNTTDRWRRAWILKFVPAPSAKGLGRRVARAVRRNGRQNAV